MSYFNPVFVPQQMGSYFVAIRIMPHLKNLGLGQDFWLTVTRELHAKVKSLEKSDQSTPPHLWLDARADLDALVNESLQIVLGEIRVDELFLIPTIHWTRRTYQPHQSTVCENGINLTVKLLDTCLSMGRVDECGSLLEKLLVSQSDLERRFTTFFTPLMPKLTALLTKHSLRADSPPFKIFFKTLIKRYADRLVGPPPSPADAKKWSPIKVGCGCRDCIELDSFTMSPEKEREVFRYAVHRRNHLRGRLSGKSAFSTKDITTGSPHGLLVEKTAEYTLGNIWNKKRAGMDAFSRGIGDVELVKSIMSGDGDGDGGGDGGGNGGEVPPADPDPDIVVAQERMAIATVANSSGSATQAHSHSKRKRSADVIDLTGDD